MKSARTRLYLPAAFLAASVILSLVVFLLPFGQSFEQGFQSFWFQLRGPQPPPEDVVVVTMDEDSYQFLNLPFTQPWPRAMHAQLLENLKELGARSVVFDILFQDVGADPAVDRRLAEAMAAIPTTIGSEIIRQKDPIMGTEITTRHEPAPLFHTVARTGFVNIPASDGVLRSLFFQIDGEPSLPLAAWIQLRPAQELMPLASTGSPYINYYGPRRSIRSVPYHQAVHAKTELPPGFFRGKTVFVGLSLRSSTGPAAKDSFFTPFTEADETTYGVEIHATVFSNLRNGILLSRLATGWELALIAGFSLTGSLLVILLRPWAALGSLAGLGLLWMGAGFLSFTQGHLFLPGASWLLLTLPGSYLASTLYFYFSANRDQRRLLRAFELYLSPGLARELSTRPEALNLGGREVQATVLFTDLEGFSTLSERLGAVEVGTMLNDYFTAMTEVILASNGTVIKFIGDAIFALWNAPLAQPEHARLAVEAALKLQEAQEAFNAAGKYPHLLTRCGIHTGPMVVGNLGSHRRFDYTAVGDAVNLGSRLEGLNKYTGTRILLSGETRAELPQALATRYLGRALVAGKAGSVALYTVLSEAENTAWNASPLRTGFPEMVTAFQEGQFDHVLRLAETLAPEAGPFAKTCAFYGTMARKAKQRPADAPPWTGELIFEGK